MKRRRGEWLLAAGATLTVVGGVLAAEGAARARSATPCPGAGEADLMSCLHVYSDVYGWALRPGLRVTASGHRISIDPRGRRETGSHDGSDGRTRIVLLGDSVAFGLDVGDEETFAARLVRLDPSLEVVNLSVPGYGTDQQRLKLEREGLAARPRLVLLAFTLANDLADNALDAFLYDGRHPKPFFTLEAATLRLHDAHLRLGPRRRAALWLTEHSALYSALVRRRKTPPPAADTEHPHWQTRLNELMARPEPLLELAAALMADIDARSRAAGATLLVVGFPTRRSYAGDAPLERDLQGRLAARGVSFVSMAERFRARGLRYEELAVDGLGHLGAAGHRHAAEILRDLVAERLAR